MVENPKVSIIIPFFNPGKLFGRCIKSAINQSLDEIEIICVDDGSTDGSARILQDYIREYPIRISRQENQGAGISRNNAVVESNGEYILFLDADDWIEPDTCEKLYNHAKLLDSDLVLFDVLWHLDNNKIDRIGYFSRDSTIDFNNFTFSCDLVKDKMMRGIYGVIWSKFYKSSFIKENNIVFPSHKIYNDIEFHFKSMLLANKISYFPKIFYHYNYVDKPSLQKSFKGGVYELCWFDVILGIRKFLNENQLFGEFKEDFLKYFIHYSQIKLDNIHDNYKQQLFIRIKYFFESLNLHFEDFKGFPFSYLVFYFHIINADNYLMFKYMQNDFDGSIVK